MPLLLIIALRKENETELLKSKQKVIYIQIVSNNTGRQYVKTLTLPLIIF